MSDKKVYNIEEFIELYQDSFIKDYNIWRETVDNINNTIKKDASPSWPKVYTYKYNAFCNTFLKRMKLWVEHYGYFNEHSSISVLNSLIQLKLRQAEKNWVKSGGVAEIINEIREQKENKKDEHTISEWFYCL